MSETTVSTVHLFEGFPNQEAAREYLVELRRPDRVDCPHCGSDKITAHKGKWIGYYTCRYCKEEFTVRTGTIIERSHVKLHTWIYDTYLAVMARKGISPMQFAREIGVTRMTSRHVLRRIREACGDNIDNRSGIVEIDEAYIGGIESAKHGFKKLKADRGTVGKTPVMGARDRSGRVIAEPVEFADLQGAIEVTVSKVCDGSTVYTGKSKIYNHLPFDHDPVDHSAGEYVRGDVQTNSMKSVCDRPEMVDPRNLAPSMGQTPSSLCE